MAEDAREKLELYEQQLAQVKQLLAADPNNAEFQKLRDDIEHVKALTLNLLGRGSGGSGGDGDGDRGGSGGGGSGGGGDEGGGGRASGWSTVGVAPSSAAAAAQDARTAAVSALPSVGFRIGGRAEVQFSEDARWYAASVDSKDGNGLYSVTYLATGTSDLVAAEYMRPIRAAQCLDKDSLQPGMACEAKYSCDGRWYKGSIVEVTPHGCMVRFDGYDMSEHVAIEHIKLASVSAGDAMAEALQIPESLQIQATDTEAVKERKRKRIKAMKKKHNLALKDKAAEQTKMGWQNFQAKTRKKRVKGHFASMKKESMFRVPDAVGAKVGVIGSGQGVTDFTVRKKHKSTG